ncbi:Ca(2+)-dependent cysteine protease [Geranomyces variabilis]|uniref:Ca(2+)-dependent cysteine protease n=1 Tax=Geranomyces variabilis TaxID=109894 RepID=A0AAD5TRA0_9FUNG|nr:Ca(2+)-dependent cysteine protease [Geranomyces variabilis]
MVESKPQNIKLKRVNGPRSFAQTKVLLALSKRMKKANAETITAAVNFYATDGHSTKSQKDLAVRKGDHVIADALFDDDWIAAYSLRTGKVGSVPFKLFKQLEPVQESKDHEEAGQQEAGGDGDAAETEKEEDQAIINRGLEVSEKIYVPEEIEGSWAELKKRYEGVNYGSLNAPGSGTRKAVIIGCNYPNSGNDLSGCVPDAHRMLNFIQASYGYKRDNIKLLVDVGETDALPTRLEILKAANWLVEGAQPGDTFCFYFSGHGTQIQDGMSAEESDELDGYDEAICTTDGDIVTDDDLHNLFVKRLPPRATLIFLADSCHSGSVLDCPFVYNANGTLQEPDFESEIRDMLCTGFHSPFTSVCALYTQWVATKDRDTVMTDEEKESFEAGFQRIGKALAEAEADMAHRIVTVNSRLHDRQWMQKTRENKTGLADIIMISGCRDSQFSQETKDADTQESGGALSSAVIKALTANKNTTYAALLHQVRAVLAEDFKQVPTISCARVMDLHTPFNL